MEARDTKRILELNNISKSFPGVKALDNVSVDFIPGEVHGLVGENGAGKSTLMKILSGVFHQDQGEITLNGESILFKDPHEAQLSGISIIFQEFSLIKNFDVTDNVFLNREPTHGIGHLDKKTARKKTVELMEKIGFDLDADKKVHDLSVVEQQVVEIIKALSVTAKVLIMDEPSAALTDKELKKLFQIIRSLKHRGVTAIYISHMLEEIFEITDRVTVLKDGKVMGTRRSSDLTKEDLIRLMVGREIQDYFPDRNGQRKEVALEVHGLSTPDFLKNISFTLYRGEVLGIAGMVGSGRNELIRSILGLEEIEGGTVVKNGEEVDFGGIQDAIDAGFGYITDDRKNLGILGTMTVLENITVADLKKYLTYGFLHKKQEIKDTKKQIKKMNIKTPTIHQQLINLSGGNQQKVLISRWLLRSPEIFIFSEPTRGIDVGAKAEIYRIMRGVVETGRSVIMVSSELPEVIGMSDRILVMKNGSLGGIIDQHDHEATEEEIMSYAVGHVFTIRKGSNPA
ncbi:MAG: sugar ABC transporter ATP-binding protein [Spirochaetales bacterium]|nr:sugar ABC transporter ATP-binding protein [Spirochaetales bacterium]